MAVTKYKVPSQAASGAETFSDSLVGRQITDGSSQLTNTNFAVDKVIPEKDSKDFKTTPFSEYITLDTLKEEKDAPTTQSGNSKKEKIKFKANLDDSSKSLFGSLKHRLSVSVSKIINKFPAAILADENSLYNITDYTAYQATYNPITNTTQFYTPSSIFFNPFDILIEKPKSNTTPSTDNIIRSFYSSYRKYVIDFSGNTYNIVGYTETNSDGNVRIGVEGNIFSGTTGTTTSFLIRPNDAITEEFYTNLDELEDTLVNRETTPKYTATFKVPRDSFDQTSTNIVNVDISWPVSKDNWNIQIVGVNFNDYIEKLSGLGEEIDGYKSNLIVRFLTAPQLFEFDSEDKKAESIFQLYGQNFDKVKKYIDNIAYMRNVSYDSINNVPDLLLKNLSQTLGLSTVNLFDEKSLQDTLYSRQQAEYLGLSLGKTLVEAEYEFYRRILTNLAHLYKSKGTRSAIQFFLKFLGAPEPLIKIDEYVYDVTGLPQQDFEDDIDEVIRGTKTNIVITGYTGGAYLTGITTGTTTLSREEYPIDSNGLPRKVTNLDSDIYFQKGAGWYDLTLDHRSSNIIDTELSVLNGRTKIIKTKPKDYTYGEDYFDSFRTLDGLDYGFELEHRIDNLKGSVVSNEDESKLTLNRKNINVYLSPSRGIEFDVYRQSRDLSLTFGGQLQPQTELTFAEYLDDVLNQLITESHISKYSKSYFPLEKVFNDYITNTNFIPYNFASVNEFINKMSPYWIQVIEQFIPATTLWTGGNLVGNNVFNRSKYAYLNPRYGVKISEPYSSDLYNCVPIEPTPTSTATPTPTPTATPTPTPSSTPTPTPTASSTPTPTPTPTPSSTSTPIPTSTPTPTESSTPTPTPTPSSTPTPTPTSTDVVEATSTPLPTSTPTPTATTVPPTATPTPTATTVPPTATPIPTATTVPPTATPIPTATTVPPTATPPPTSSPTPTPTNPLSECYILQSAPYGGCTFVFKNQNGTTITTNIPSEDVGLCFTECVTEVISDDCGFVSQGVGCLDPQCDCSPPVVTIQIATNNSLDISVSLSAITVNNVAVTNVSGIDPNTSGNGATVDTNQIGTYDVTIYYYAGIAGQKITFTDSNNVTYCQNTTTGPNNMTFTSVVINQSSPPIISAEDGTCT
jgi:hypothetical protein